jgi:hypothetical protein
MAGPERIPDLGRGDPDPGLLQELPGDPAQLHGAVRGGIQMQLGRGGASPRCARSWQGRRCTAGSRIYCWSDRDLVVGEKPGFRMIPSRGAPQFSRDFPGSV